MSTVKFVPGKGNKKADLIILGEAPGKDEEEKLEPFVGKAGQLVDEMLDSLNRSREEVYITNTVKVRPPENRTPTPEEIESWKKFLMDELYNIKPKVILTLGKCAATVMGVRDQKTALSKVRKNSYSISLSTVVPTYHPAYLLRNPSAKELVKEDLKIVDRILREKSKK